MKLKLSVGEIPYSGYLNVDPIPQSTPASCTIICRDPRILDDIVNQAECTEILAPNILDYIHSNFLVSFLVNVTSKLRHNGKIIIGGTELNTITRAYMIGEIKPEEMTQVLYGTNFGAWQTKVGCYPIGEICNILTELNIQIIRKNVQNTSFFIEGKRP